MNVRKLRGSLLSISLAAAILLGSAAIRLGAAPVSAASGGAEMRLPAETEFLLTERRGEVCIYAGDALISNTGIPVRTLPRRDREELERGIRARGERELAALLEDFGA